MPLTIVLADQNHLVRLLYCGLIALGVIRRPIFHTDRLYISSPGSRKLAVEVLSDILRSMRVTGSVYHCDYLRPPWSMQLKDADRASFHMVRRGECWLTSDDVVERLGPGDLVFVSAGRSHTLSGSPSGKLADGVSSDTLLLCGYCRFVAPPGHPLLRAIPTLTIIREEELLAHVWLRRTLDQLSAEYMSQRPGSEVVVDRLTEVVIVELIRIDFGRPGRTGLIGALHDKQLSRALSLMHAQPGQSWTLDSLAGEVAVSRAVFAKRFKEQVGQTMFEYLTALRMQRAQHLLHDTRLPLFEIARNVGYDSDLAFTRAFKRQFGVTPTRYKRELQNNRES